MSIQFAPYTAESAERVRAFNERIARGGCVEYQLPLNPGFLEASQSGPLPWEYRLALLGGEVRGGYLVRHQQFSFSGEMRTVGFYNLSLSEAVVDKRYAAVSMKMVADALSRSPLLFALGMGGLDRRLPQFLKALGWSLHEVPFLFRALRPSRLVRNIVPLRSTRLRRAVLDAAAFTGAAWAGIGVAQALRRKGPRRRPAQPPAQCEVVPEFGSFADELWAACRADFAMIGERDSRALNELYAPSMPRLARLKVTEGGRVAGWAVVRDTQMAGDRRFGNLRVGTVVDCLATHPAAPAVARAAVRFLEDRGVDVIVSNQSHRDWSDALRRLGFLDGPSNYILAASKGLSRLLDPFAQNVHLVHFTRGDGDGPIHL